jgi:hypothetical protein
MSDPNPKARCAHVDPVVDLRLAKRRAHERDYPHERPTMRTSDGPSLARRVGG